MAPAQQASFKALRKDTDEASQGWTTAAREAFKAAAEGPAAVNVVVSASKLLPTLAKLMLFSLNRHVAAHDVYSVWMEGSRLEALRELQGRFPRAELLLVGDGDREREAAHEAGVGFFEAPQNSLNVL